MQHLHRHTSCQLCMYYTIHPLYNQEKKKRNYFLFHQRNKIEEWRGHSEICLQMTRDRQFRYSLQTAIGQIWHIYLWDVCNNFGLLILCGSLQHLKMVSCPTVGSVMMANGGSSQACLSPVISCYGSLSAFFFSLIISCSEDYVRFEMKWPRICPLLHVRHYPAYHS